MDTRNHIRIVIVGGGFAGVEAALRLSKKHLPHASITLISKHAHFEYYPMLYRVVTGKSPMEVCIPLSDIFHKTKVRIIHDEIAQIDLSSHILINTDGGKYHYDYLVLALGSETVYFGVPGLQQFSYSFKSIQSALELKNHLHDMFRDHGAVSGADRERDLRVVVAGAGPSGVELAGELAAYMKNLAVMHEVGENHHSLMLIDGAPRILPTMPEHISDLAHKRLTHLGVHIHTDEKVSMEDAQAISTEHMKIPSATVIWTAGVKVSHVYSQIKGLTFAKNGRVVVDDYLQAKGNENVFIIGDGADTLYSGLAQTAIYDGRFVAQIISKKIKQRKKLPAYIPKKVSYAMPIGPSFAIIFSRGVTISGRLGWWIRKMIDLKYLMSILPLGKALVAFTEGEKNCETCITCQPETAL